VAENAVQNFLAVARFVEREYDLRSAPSQSPALKRVVAHVYGIADLGGAQGDARLGRVAVDLKPERRIFDSASPALKIHLVENPPLQFRYRPCWRCTVEEKGLAEK
jgi:hypothetical protein